MILRSSVHQSRVCVNMVYFGKSVHLSHDLTDMKDEVKVFQQHCGGENLCVYRGKLQEGGQCDNLQLCLFRYECVHGDKAQEGTCCYTYI